MSALVARFGLTELQDRFVRAVAAGTPPAVAAVEAGYSEANSAYRLLALPSVATAIHYELQRLIVAEGAPLAFSTIMRIIKDDKASERVRGDLSVRLLGIAGHVAPSPIGQKDQATKSLSEMTADELHVHMESNMAEIARLEAELAARAKDVSPALDTQDNTQDGAKPLTYLD